MRETESPSPPDAELGDRVFAQILELWVRPELEHRGLPSTSVLSKALVVFEPGKPILVAINDECEWIAAVKATGPIAKGERIRLDAAAIQHLVRPANIDGNAGWIGFLAIGGQVHVAFDFRRNRARARELLVRAREFQATARWALAQSYRGPSLEAAFAAAELAVSAHLLVFEDEMPRSHDEREKRWSSWTRLGNAPLTHAETLRELRRARDSARYAQSSLTVANDQATDLLEVVDEIIADAIAASADRHARPDESSNPPT